MIEIDPETDEYLSFAARIAGLSKGQVVAQLIALTRAERPGSDRIDNGIVPIHCFYEGEHTSGQYMRKGGLIEILSGPLTGRTFKTPSEAAREVVSNINPQIMSNRNGWTFWIITESRSPLQSIRYDDV